MLADMIFIPGLGTQKTKFMAANTFDMIAAFLFLNDPSTALTSLKI